MTDALPPGEFARALQAKRNAARRRRMWLFGGGGGAVLLVALLVYVLFFSPLLSAREVRVTGASLDSQTEIVAAAQVAMGTPLLRQDTAAIIARVESLPAVRQAEVRIAWPQAVELRVVERSASFQVAHDKGYDWVDAEAVVFHRSAEPAADVVLAEMDVTDERLRQDVANVVHALPKELTSQVEKIAVASIDRISLHLADDREVIWGSAESSELKADVLQVLLRVNASVYDVSAPENPTTR